MNTEEHDDLWELLGKARETKVSPFFSRNVLRAIREEEQEKVGFFSWLRAHWKVHNQKTCPRCRIALIKAHLGTLDRRSFYCETCQKRHG